MTDTPDACPKCGAQGSDVCCNTVVPPTPDPDALAAQVAALREALRNIVRMTGKAADAPLTSERWLDRIEEAALDALSTPAAGHLARVRAEAFRAGQERMRERAAEEALHHGAAPYEGDVGAGWRGCSRFVADAIAALEPEDEG